MKRLFGICLLLVLLAAPVGGAAATATRPSGDRTACLLFIGGGPLSGAPIPVADLRRVATAEAEATIAALGWGAVPGADLDPSRRQWRVRSGLLLPPGFLAACREEAQVDRLVVLQLINRQDRLMAMARLVSCPDGVLLGAAVVEAPALSAASLEPDRTATSWQTATGNLVTKCLCALSSSMAGRTDPSGEPLLMLPAAGVATSADADLAATHLYVARILAENRWRLVDPAVVSAALTGAGHQPTWLGREARGLLERQFGARQIILPELISYEAMKSGRQVYVVDDQGGTPAMAVRDFALALRLVDLRAGRIVVAGYLYVDASRQTGWFGRRSDRSLLDHIEIAIRDLWLTFLKDLEAS